MGDQSKKRTKKPKPQIYVEPEPLPKEEPAPALAPAPAQAPAPAPAPAAVAPATAAATEEMDDWEQNAEEDEAAVDVAPVSEEPPPVVSQAKPQVEEPSPGPAPVAVEEKVDAEVEEAEEVAEVVVGDEKVSKLKEPDPRPHMNCVFIGHVDAGKSTTCGNVLFLTGCVDERAIEKYQKEAKDKNRDSWFLAYIMDTNEEEKAKGKTVEVGRAHFEAPGKRFTILDAPGHKSYVPNMIAGASQADIGVLIISARKGEFETGFERGGQTREHTTL